VGADCRLGERSYIGPGCLLGRGVEIGSDCRLIARVTVCDDVRLGDRVLVQPGAVIGSDGFGYAMNGEHWVRIPQLGSVQIGDDVDIGANTTIDRGAVDDTVVEAGVKLDNLIQVGHNVRIGAGTAIAGCVGIAGSTHIGRHCQIGGGAGFNGHIEVADGVHVSFMTAVSKSLRESGSYASAPLVERKETWRRNSARFRQLDQLARRLIALEKRLGRKEENQ
jgi:UDP-3-O-[3-hydroxymyristoyl] glucosamine N-acyltransferase